MDHSALSDLLRHSILKLSVDTDQDTILDVAEGGSTPYIVGQDDRMADSDEDGASNSKSWAIRRVSLV